MVFAEAFPRLSALAADVAKLVAERKCAESIRVGVERFMDQRQADPSEHDVRRRAHFEHDLLVQADILDGERIPAGWIASELYERRLSADELESLDPALRRFSVDYRGASNASGGPSDCVDFAGCLRMVAPAPVDLCTSQRPDVAPVILIPFHGIDREPTFEELCFAFGALNDGAGLPPIVPLSHPLRHPGNIYSFIVGLIAESAGEIRQGRRVCVSDSWSDGLAPLALKTL